MICKLLFEKDFNDMRMRNAAVVAGLALGLMSGAAKAAYIVDFEQMSGNVVVTGHGSLDLSGATVNFTGGNENSIVDPSESIVVVGSGDQDSYSVSFFGPSNFGNGGASLTDDSTGPVVGLDVDGFLIVPHNYQSNDPLGTSTSTYHQSTFSSLGLAVGTYVYSFQTSGEILDTFTIEVGTGVSAVPLPASAPMFGAALLALGAVGYGLKRKKAAANA